MELDEGMDAAYAAAMQRLGELKAKPPDELTDAEKKEKLRLANRESARKLRRKHASQLETGAAEVTRLEAEHAQHQAQLAEGWHRYTELKDENERLMQELQQLRALQAKKVGTSAPPVSAAAPGGATTSAGRVLAGLAAADAAPQPEPAAASGTAPGVAPAPH